jgi:hypothetical protein
MPLWPETLQRGDLNERRLSGMPSCALDDGNGRIVLKNSGRLPLGATSESAQPGR